MCPRTKDWGEERFHLLNKESIPAFRKERKQREPKMLPIVDIVSTTLLVAPTEKSNSEQSLATRPNARNRMRHVTKRRIGKQLRERWLAVGSTGALP